MNLSANIGYLFRGLLKPTDARIAKLEEELAERREEIDLLETELAAAKRALAFEEKEADLYASEMRTYAAEVRACDEAILMLHELAQDKLEPADDVRFDTIARAIKRSLNKAQTVSTAMIAASLGAARA